MKKLVFLLFLISSFGFSQSLEENIYVAAETFISNQNNKSLLLLNKHETAFKKLIKTKDEQLALVFLQCHKGYYLNELGNLNEAINTYEDASQRFFNNKLASLSDFDIIENCLNPLGNLYTKTGDFTNAISTINQYIFLSKKSNNKKHQISGAINLSKLYQTLGKHETVVIIIEESLKFKTLTITQKEHLQNIKIHSLITLKRYNEASTLNNSLKNSPFQKHKNNYLIALQKGEYNKALSSFEKAKPLIVFNNLSARHLAKFYIEEAQLHILLENKKEASKALKLALNTLLPNLKSIGLPKQESLFAENTFIDIFDLNATLEKDPKIALEYLNLSFYVSELLQKNWTSQENKIQNQATDRLRSETCIDILFNEYIRTKNKDFIIEAFQYAEYNKASVLKKIFRKKLQLQHHPNDSLLVKEFYLLTEQERITSLLIKEQLNTSKASEINNLSQNLNAISLQLKALKSSISKRYSEINNTISIDELQYKLQKDKAVLIEYFYGKNTLYQFIISEKDITLESIRLNNETKKNITDFIHLFDNASVINNDISKFTKQAYKLFELFNFNKTKNQKNIVIIPDGLLNFIPFEALLTSETTTTSFSKMPFVIKSNIIAYNSSSQFYLTNLETDKNNNLLGLFPVFENSKQPLKYSINEASSIENEMDSNILLKDKATKKYFIEKAKNYGILHLSTHASSGDFVTPAHIEFYDETLYLNELYSIHLNTNLVVLSACETGIGKLYKGEGPMSVARGFQYAGAKNLLFSLWQINDLSTSQIMQSFYKEYNNNASGYISNHQSKISYLQNDTITNAKKSPYYWSSFVFYGELTEASSNNIAFYVFIGIAIILIIVFLAFKLKTHARNTSGFSY